jgi:hypothetical protein
VKRRGFILGSGGGLLLEPVADVAHVAAEDGGRLLDVAPQQHHRSAHPHHREDEVGERHRTALNPLPLPPRSTSPLRRSPLTVQNPSGEEIATNHSVGVGEETAGCPLRRRRDRWLWAVIWNVGPRNEV